MKQAPSKVHNFWEALEAEVLDKPFIFYTVADGYFYVESASVSRNIKAENFCKKRNKQIEQETQNAKAPPLF